MQQTKAALQHLLLAAALLLCLYSSSSHAQENAQYQIPPSLIECYNTSYFMNRANRLPSTIDTLITLIEKVENSYLYNQDIRQLAVSLIHRFRQDGIQRAPGIANTPGVIPYSPIGQQFAKFRILLTRLIPGNANNFPNSTLTREERCSLHFMLSSSIDTSVRGDENQVCSQLSQYTANRYARSVKDGQEFSSDVEMLTNLNKKGGGYLRELRNKQMGGYYDYDDFGTTNINSISQCPVENGVMWTPWGTVTAGTVIAGIAAGLQQQTVQLRTLLALARRPGAYNQRQSTTITIDNRWAATLAGDLAEVALVQVPQTINAFSQTPQATVGANGAWNSTVLAKWYFLKSRQNLEMTDAEIRGGMDGLIMAMNVVNWRTQASNLKLSQLLRMYYSMDGVLGSGIMACNRKSNYPSDTNMMISQTAGFAQVLDSEMQLPVTLEQQTIGNFSTLAAQALIAYIPSQLNDVSCEVSNAVVQDISENVVGMTNIYVFLDTSWQYNTVNQYLIYILQNLNINPYASSVTLLNAADGTTIVNTTNYLSDVFENWNITTQATFTPGFSLTAVLNTVQNLTQTYMAGQQTNSSVGGFSMVALMMPNNGMVTAADSNYATTQMQFLSEQVPDLHFIYYTGGSIDRFSAFVKNPSEDLFALNTGSPVATSSGKVVRRIKRIPRRIDNPRCGYNWVTASYGTDQMAQYVRPGKVNFYRMVPNYFFGAGSGRYVNIQAQNSMQFTICTSRSVVLPMQNSTTGSFTGSSTDISCQSLANGMFSYDLSNVCNGYYTITQCPPLYISVQAPSSSSSGGSSIQTVSCSDPACQTPDQAKYTISVVNLGCYSGVAGLYASLSTIILAYLMHLLMQ